MNKQKQNNKLVPELRFPEFENDGEWEEKMLRNIGDIITGSTPKTSERNNYNGEMMFVSPADISEGRYITKTKTTLSELGFSKTRPIKENSVLFVCIGSTIGKVAQNTKECASNQQINSLVPFDEYYSEFIYSALEYNASRIASFAGIQAVPIINKSQFSNISIYVPTIKEEQKKIADCLCSLDDLIGLAIEKLNFLKIHKKGLLQQLFPAEGETVPKLRFPEFENDGDWEITELGKCLFQQPEYGIGAPAVPFSENLPTYLRITDISEDGHFLYSKKVSVEREVTEDNYLDEGDIVFARTGASVGKSYKYRIKDGRLVFAGFLIRVKPDPKKLNSELLFQFVFSEEYWNWVKITSPRSGQPGINSKEYSLMPLILPSALIEQKKIANCLSSLDDLIEAQREKIEVLKEHKKGLMQQLFPIKN